MSLVGQKDRLSKESLALIVVALTACANLFDGAFQFDDGHTLFENPHVDRWQIFVGHLTHMVRPVLYATFLIDRALYGESPMGYHLVNLLLHLGSGLLLYRILSRAVRKEAVRIPFWASLVFLVHPIQTEAVTYISGRASGLMSFFYLLALFLYINASEAQDSPKAYRLYLHAAVGSFVLSLGSKETAMTFPLVLLLRDTVVSRLSGRRLGTAILSRHLPFWIVLLVAGVWAWSHPRYSALMHFSFSFRPFWENVLSQVHATGYAMLLFFCPWNQNFDHDLAQFHSIDQWPLPLDLLSLGGLATVACVTLRRLPLFSFGIMWFFIQCLPTAVIPRADLLSERNLYLASIGFILATVVCAVRLAKWLTKAAGADRIMPVGSYAAGGIVVIVLSIFTFQRNALYRDQVSLWTDTVAKSPQKARPHNNLGHAYALLGEWDRAIDEFRIAAQLDPDYALAQKNLRDAYLHRVGRR
jgi:tetratricopeptide (TPR) repeat protein